MQVRNHVRTPGGEPGMLKTLPGRISKGVFAVVFLSLILVTLACGDGVASGGGSAEILIDGSSTVFPISQAVAEEFRKERPDVQIPVGISGTGGGFKRFVTGEIDIADASRRIKDVEREEAVANGIEFTEFVVAYDGLSVVINNANDFATCLTVRSLAPISGS